MSWKFLPVFVVALIAISTHVDAGQNLAEPTGPIILVVDGNISHTNTAKSSRFDMAMLKKILSHTIKTETPWTDGMQTFEGPLLSDVLKSAGLTGVTIKAVAINDYAVKIPVSDTEKYPVILAHTLNGKVMPIREKGPLWVIYPWTDNPELRKETIYAKSIWQVKKLSIQ